MSDLVVRPTRPEDLDEPLKHWRRRNGALWDSVVMGLLLAEETS